MWVRSECNGDTYRVLAEFGKYYWVLTSSGPMTAYKMEHTPVDMYCVEWWNKESDEVVFAKVMENTTGITCSEDEYIIVRRA